MSAIGGTTSAPAASASPTISSVDYPVLPAPIDDMNSPTSEGKSPQIQREDVILCSPKPHPYSARNLLLGVFKKSWQRPPTADKLRTEHAQVLLNTPIGRDFNLITAAGVEFMVHSIMLIGGSKMLQEGLFPGNALHPNPPKLVNLPANFHPILVDRVVNFIYTSDYDFDPTSPAKQLTKSNFNFHNASFIPTANPPSPATVALAEIRDYTYHLHMYALGEDLDYQALKSAAHTKLVEILVRQRGRDPATFKDLVGSVFASPASPLRICNDADGILAQLVLAALIAHERKTWHAKARGEFVAMMQDAQYANFWTVYNGYTSENPDLIEAGDVARALRDQRKLNVRKGRSILLASLGAAGIPQKRKDFKKRHTAKDKTGTVGAGVKGGEENGDMEMDMD